MGLDPRAEPGQRDDLPIAEARLRYGLRRWLTAPDLLRAAAGNRADGRQLVADAPLGDLHGRAHHEVVRVDGSGDHGLAQPGRGVDHDLAAAAGDGVGREHHPGHLGRHHPLDDHGQVDGAVVHAVGGPVGDGAVGPQRGPAPADGVEHRAGPHHVEEGVLLAREAGVREVLGGGGRPYGHGPLGVLPYGSRDVGGHGGGEHESAGATGQFGESGGVTGGRALEGAEHVVEPGVLGDAAVRLRCQADPWGNREPGPREHAQVGRLAADQGKHLSRDVLKFQDEGVADGVEAGAAVTRGLEHDALPRRGAEGWQHSARLPHSM